MTSLLFALAWHQSNLQDVHIVATTLEKAVAKISDIYRSPMDVSTLLRDKIVLVDAIQASEEDVRNHIASTLNATWEKKDNGWHLGKSPQQLKEDEMREASLKLRFLKKTFEIRGDAANTKATYDANFAKQIVNQMRNEAKNRDPEMMAPPGPTAAGYGLPNQRLMSRFLLKFGLDKIASVPNGTRTVFALRPNAMQVPLGVNIQNDLEQFRTEQNVWLKTYMEMAKDQEGQAKQTRGGGEGAEVAIAMASGSEDDNYNTSFNVLPDSLANVYFVVYCSSDGVYTLRLVGVPNDARQPYFAVGATTFEGAFAGMSAEDFQTKPVPEFKLSDEANDFKKFFYPNEEKLSPEKLKMRIDRFADPVAYDPLSYGLSESLIFDAHRIKRNIVACLDDQNLNIFEPFFADSWFQEKFRMLNEGLVLIDDGWVGVRKFPYSEPNIPRTNLKAIIARVRKNNRVELDDRAELAALRPRTNAVSYIERLLDRFANTSSDEGAEDDALKCLGMLSQGERERAMSQGGIPYSQLSDRLKQHLFACAYYNEHNRLWPLSNGPVDTNGFATQEPTLLAPNGIPPSAIFRIEAKDQEQIKAADGPGSYGLMTDAKGWGSTKYQVDHPEDYPGVNFTLDPNTKLKRVTQHTFELKLTVNPACRWSSQIQTISQNDSNSFTLATLPEDLKADFKAGYDASAKAAEERRNRKKQGGGGG